MSNIYAKHTPDDWPFVTCPGSGRRDKLEPINTGHGQAWCTLCGDHLGEARREVTP